MNKENISLDCYCVKNGIYSLNPKLKKIVKYTEIINRKMNGIEGGVFVPYISDSCGKLFYSLLFEENKSKVLFEGNFRGRKYIVKLKKLLDFLFIKKKNTKCILKTEKKLTMKLKLYAFISAKPILDIYEIIGENKTPTDDEWFKGIGLNYTDIFNDIEAYNNSSDAEKAEAAKKVFGDFFYIKDFIHAKEWLLRLRALLKDDRDSLEIYENLWIETERQLKEIKEALSSSDHIVVNWIDALRFDDLDKMSWLYQEKDGGISFNSMYTVTAYTSATLRTILSGKNIIDDRMFRYSYSEVYRQGCELLTVLRKHGYDVLYSSPVFVDWESCNKEIAGKSAMYERREYMPSTLIQYEAVRYLSNAKSPCLMIIHNLSETHSPWLNPLTVGTMEYKYYAGGEELEKVKRRIVESCSYLDEQMEFYGNLYDKVKYRIYMSDHGCSRRWLDKYFIEGLYHVVFFICGSKISAHEIDEVISLNDFSDIIQALLTGESLEAISGKRRFAMIQFDDVYSDMRLEEIKKGNKGADFREYIQMRGLISKKDIYARWSDGYELYTRFDRQEQLIDTQEYYERIQELRKACGKKYIDIYKEDRYKTSRELYEFLNITRSKENEYV